LPLFETAGLLRMVGIRIPMHLKLPPI